MEEGMPVVRYWCHVCFQVVNPIMETEVKCPTCHNGFVEEISSANVPAGGFNESDFALDRILSLWAPILFGILGNRHRQRSRRNVLDVNDDQGSQYDDNVNWDRSRSLETENELDRELGSVIQPRRRSSTSILQLLQRIRAGMMSSLGNQSRSARERERVIFINPFHRPILMQGSRSLNRTHIHQNDNSLGSLGDYFIGPGFDLLLQHLAENDPNRYGTPPARKEAVRALPTVKIKDNSQCYVCLDDFEHDAEGKEMPCKHKFHGACLLPWLELHSSCPVCRYQLPVNDPKADLEGSRNRRNNINEGRTITGRNENGTRENTSESSDRRFTLPWPFGTLFPSLESSIAVEESSLIPSTTSSSSSSSVGSQEATSHIDGHN